MLLRPKILALSLSLLLITQNAVSSSLEKDIENINKKAKEFQIQKPNIDEKIRQKAYENYQYTQTPEFKSQVEKFKKDLQIIMGVEVPEQFYKSSQESAKVKTAKITLSHDERLYIFISYSVPELTLKNFLKYAENIDGGIYLVLRGGIGGITRIQPTANWATRLLKKNPHCEEECEVYKTKILIDPFLFRKYNITKVPAVVYARGILNSEGLSEGLNTVTVSDYWVSYGDVSLEYHLKLIGEKAQRDFLGEQM